MWLIGLVIAAVAVIAVPLIIYFYLAPRNLWFTFVKEGTAKIVVRADKFEKALIQWEGHTLDQDWNVIEGKEPWHPLGGLRYYGFWPLIDIYIYNFKWTGVAEDGQIVHHPRETLDYIILKDDVYWCEVEQAEDIELLPLEVELILTARVINPYKALFRIENWLEAVVNRIKPFVRDYTTTASYAELIKDAARIGTEIYKRLEEENLLPEFRGDYGVDVKKIEVKSINPPKEYREVTLLKYVAERELEKVVVGANAEKQRIEIVAEGEKARIETVYKAVEKFGDLGQLIRTLEALEQSPLAASVTVQAIPGVQEMLRGVFGKPLETVTPEEFKDLKEKVEKIDKLSKKGR